jgi:hypothetical protein
MKLVGSELTYERVGFDKRKIVLGESNYITQGKADCESIWRVYKSPRGRVLAIHNEDGSLTCWLDQVGFKQWEGFWENHEKMPVRVY